MVHVAQWLKSGLLLPLLVLAAIAALGLFAVLAVAMRPLLMFGFLLAVLAAAVLSIFSPAFREWFSAVGERETEHSGLRLATEVAVHPGHSWARFSGAGEAAVGVDDFVQAALGPVETVELPAKGYTVKQGERLFTLRRGGRKVDVRSPVTGVVVERNDSLVSHPEAVNEAPYTRGWAVRLRADNPRVEERSLMRGKSARDWLRKEIDRLVSVVLADDALASALPDGGALTDQLHDHIDDGAWEELTRSFF